jgi:hypothetical protein
LQASIFSLGKLFSIAEIEMALFGKDTIIVLCIQIASDVAMIPSASHFKSWKYSIET